MSGEHTQGHGGWSAVVYGRTYRIDRWWRALPAGETSGGPLGRTVLAVVAGGARLDAGPRFVLYRGAGGVLVGAACRMPLLGPAMAYDEHGRPLYGFVGWHHPDRSAAHGLPGLDELEASFPQWAGDTYRAWAGPVWEAVREPDAVTLPSTAEPAPWPDRGRPVDPAAAGRWPAAHTADVHLLPTAQASGLWDAALAAGPMADCVLTTGWQQSRDAREPGLTHACCADVTEYRRAPRPAPPAPARAPDPAPKRAGERVQKPARHSREKEGKGFLGWMGEALRHVIDGDRSDAAPPAGRPRPAKRGGTPHRPAATGAHLTGGAAYEPEPPAQGLLGRPHEVDAEEASFDGYFGAFGSPAPTTTDSAPATASPAEDTKPRPAPGAAGFARPGTAAAGDGATPAPAGPSAAGSGPASGPGGFARPGTAAESGGATSAPPGPSAAGSGGFARPGTAAQSGRVTPTSGGPSAAGSGPAFGSGGFARPGTAAQSGGVTSASGGPSAVGSGPASGTAGFARPGTAAESGGATSASGGPSAAGSGLASGAGGFARPGTAADGGGATSAPGGPSAAGSGSGGFARPGTAAEGGGATPVPGAGRDDIEAEAAGADSGTAGAPGPGAWGALTPDADGPAGPGDPHRCDPGGSA
ncbi:hypothetical protein [Streptomyces yangpuensis]|uniref:hypothetical protein n=1 Tax=Streptomyces yangpuensis TaxID=1648182 RepID=UPI00380BE57B